MKCVSPALGALTAIGLAVFPLALPILASDCDFDCEGSSGPCNPMHVDVEVDCGATRCHVKVKLSGAAGSASNESDQDTGSNNEIRLCVGASPNECCVTVSPCFGSDWGDVGSSCAALCHECTSP